MRTVYFFEAIFNVMIYHYWRAAGLVVASSPAGGRPPLFFWMKHQQVVPPQHQQQWTRNREDGRGGEAERNEKEKRRWKSQVRLQYRHRPSLPRAAARIQKTETGTTPLFRRWLILERWPAVHMHCTPLGYYYTLAPGLFTLHRTGTRAAVAREFTAAFRNTFSFRHFSFSR